MRVVDNETRREVQNKRLSSLEADNYNEELGQGDAAYESNSDSGGEGGTKKARKQKDGASTKRSKVQKGANMTARDKWAARRPRSIDKIIDEFQYSKMQKSQDDTKMEFISHSDEVNFVNATVNPSRFPARHFCSVCGYHGNYSCVRCGMRFCSVKCNVNHKETRCLKFGNF
jgi:zinc finger HIT domain-containing protein 1